jgi:hypothetical protein
MSKGEWICECSAGSCDFDSEAEAREGASHKFCGINPKITRRQPMSDDKQYAGGFGEWTREMLNLLPVEGIRCTYEHSGYCGYSRAGFGCALPESCPHQKETEND